MTAGGLSHLRPRFHVTLPYGFLNDPNGPIEVDGAAHLYFQSRQGLDLALPVAWGHATSADYVRWTLQRPAMVPVPGGPDTDGCWSGNTVRDGDRIRAFYSAAINGKPYQSVVSALSEDGGRSFGSPVQVVPDPAPDEGVIMFRDPFVWREADGWSMAVGVGYAGRGAAIRLYRSDDLQSWFAKGDLAQLERAEVAGEDTGAAWECPQVLSVGGRRVALVASWSPEGGPRSVLSFDVDAPPVPVRVDHGSNFYAPSVQQHSRFGPLLYGWLTEGRGPDSWSDGWSGVISLPRVVWLGPDMSVRSAPVPTVQTLRSGDPVPADAAVTGGQCEIEVPAGSGRVVIAFDGEQRVEVVLDRGANTVTVDNARAGGDPDRRGGPMIADDAFDPDAGRPAARILLDGSVLEVFTSAGRVLSTRVYPKAPPPWRIAAPAGARCWTLQP